MLTQADGHTLGDVIFIRFFFKTLFPLKAVIAEYSILIH